MGPLGCCDPQDSDKARRGTDRFEALRTGSGQPCFAGVGLQPAAGWVAEGASREGAKRVMGRREACDTGFWHVLLQSSRPYLP